MRSSRLPYDSSLQYGRRETDHLSVGDLVVRTAGDPRSVMANVQREVHAVNPTARDCRRLPALAAQLQQNKEELFRLCDREDFSVDLHEAIIGRVESEVAIMPS